jgi:hypothetical protein
VNILQGKNSNNNNKLEKVANSTVS